MADHTPMITVAAAAMLAASLNVQAQSPPPSDTGSDAKYQQSPWARDQQSNGASAETTNGASAETRDSDATANPSASDLHFVDQAAQSGHAEIAEARMAVKDSSNPKLKRVAEMIERDHRAADRQLAAIAKREGITLPPRSPVKGSSPSDFSDSDYISSQIQAHQAAISLFQKETQEGSDGDLKRFAQQALGVLKHHLKALQALQNA